MTENEALRAAVNFAIGYITSVAGWASLGYERESANKAVETIQGFMEAATLSKMRDRERERGSMTENEALRAAVNFAIGYITSVAGWASLGYERESANKAVETIQGFMEAATLSKMRDREREAASE